MTSDSHSAPVETEAVSTVSDYIALLKPGVMSLVVFTGMVGMVVAPGSLHPLQYVLTVFCIAVASGAGAAINMWYDRDIDAVMKRTQNRPVPAGRVVADDALAYGIALSLFSVMILGLSVHWLAGGILAFAIFFYAVVYTMWLKRSTPQNIVIGGAAGAFPPMIGWVAVTGDITIEPIILFLIIFLWTPPHFWALALYKNDDYTRANVPMMPVVAGAKATKRQMLFYSKALLLCTLIPFELGFVGIFYTVSALVLGITFIYFVWQTSRHEDHLWARRTFGFSIAYLFLLFSAMMIDAILLPF